MYPIRVAAADLNGDGWSDLVVNADSISVLLGNGDGTFGAKAAVLGSGSFAIADFNGDRKPDLAVVLSGGSTVSVLLGQGDGSFGPSTGFDTGPYPFFVASGDLNRDGKSDLVVLNDVNNGAVSVLLGLGNGAFGPKNDFRVGMYPSSAAIGDLNADGNSDLVVANFGYDRRRISVLLGRGDGSFAPKTEFETGLDSPQSFAMEDLNGDGRLDVAVVNAGVSGTVSVYPGRGDGTFGARAEFEAGQNAASIAVGDLNGDGRPDFAVANDNYYGGVVSVLLGAGDGSFDAGGAFAAGLGPMATAMADFNGDGAADLAVADSQSSTVSVLLGHGDGTFGANAYVVAASNPVSAAIGDLNGDGRSDLVITNDFSNTVSVLLGLGDGTFGAKTDFGVGRGPFSVAIGDLNSDGKADLAVANFTSSTMSVLLGNGDGSFGGRIDYGVGIHPISVAIGDLNGDRRADLVVANASTGTVSVLLGQAEGSMSDPIDYAAGYGPASVAIADLDGDRNLDVAVANYYGGAVSVLLGRGDGSLEGSTGFVVGANPKSVAVGDLNGDGKPDLAVANQSYDATVSVLLGLGDGSFGVKADFKAGLGPACVAIEDFNADGKLDLAVANEYSDGVSVLLGQGDGAFAAKADFGTGLDPVFVATGDLNGDGSPDLVVPRNNRENSVSILLHGGRRTPVLLQGFAIETLEDGARVRWCTSRRTTSAQFDLRAACGEREWKLEVEPSADGQSFWAHDLAVEDAPCATEVSYTLWYRDGPRGRWMILAQQTASPFQRLPRTALLVAYPNPFQRGIDIPFSLARGERIRVDVYDAAGRAVAVLARGGFEAGRGLVTWDGCDLRGRPVAAGVYFVHLEAGSGSQTQRIIRVR